MKMIQLKCRYRAPCQLDRWPLSPTNLCEIPTHSSITHCLPCSITFVTFTYKLTHFWLVRYVFCSHIVPSSSYWCFAARFLELSILVLFQCCWLTWSVLETTHFACEQRNTQWNSLWGSNLIGVPNFPLIYMQIIGTLGQWFVKLFN